MVQEVLHIQSLLYSQIYWQHQVRRFYIDDLEQIILLHSMYGKHTVLLNILSMSRLNLDGCRLEFSETNILHNTQMCIITNIFFGKRLFENNW